MSAFYRCDYCGTECEPGTDIRDHEISVAVGAVDKKWARDHTDRRTSRIKVLIGEDSINPDGEHFGHDLCDRCISAHLHALLLELNDSEADR